MSDVIGGIEGGATHSRVILINTAGETLTVVNAEGTNHHLMGLDECRKKIAEMINLAKTQAKIPVDQPLLALGLSLSGCENEETNQDLVNGLEKKYPKLSKQYTIGSDTDGSVAATSPKGGIVSIVGTGSNTLLINPDGTRAQCGGWGFLLGDEGSAWKMAFRAIKMCFDALDQLEPTPYPFEPIWHKVQTFFDIKTQPDLLEVFYGSFSKARIASFCKLLADLAHQGDKLSQHIFYESGVDIAKALRAVIAKASPELTKQEGGVRVSCVGSVWLSWDLLKPGFEDLIQKQSDIKEMSLVRIISVGGLGAAYLACDKFNINVPRNYSDNYEVFYHYSREIKCSPKCGK